VILPEVGVPVRECGSATEQAGIEGRLAVLGGEVALFDRNLGDQRCPRTDADVTLLQRVVIDLVDGDVLVPLRGSTQSRARRRRCRLRGSICGISTPT
jgi:hypothetical protein